MSMGYYGVNEYGLLLDYETMGMLASKICKDYSDEEYDRNPYEFNDDVRDAIGALCEGDFIGEALKIQENGDDTYDLYNNFVGETIYYIPIRHYPNLFTAPYNNIDEIIDEMKAKVGEYLPDDFDYRNSLRHIIGTYYG